MFISKFEKNVKRFPEKTAIVFSQSAQQECSYSKLYKSSLSVAFLLSSRFSKGSRVLIMITNPIHFCISLLACFYSNMIAVPIKSYKRNDERLQAIVKNCDPACLFAENDYTNEYLKNCSIFNISNLLQEQERELSAPDAKNSDIAYLQYTSGSIALPKGIKISFANLSANLSMIKNHFMHDESTVIAGWLPLYHDMGLVGNLLQALYCGTTYYCMLSRDFIIRPLKWLEMIQNSGAHTSGGPNFSYEYCCAQIDTERLDLDLSGWKVAFNGSEPVHYNTIMRFYNKFKPFGLSYNAMTPCYGLAEATLFVSAKHKDEPFAYAAKQQASREKKEYHSVPSDMKMVSSGHIAENISVYVMEPGSMNVLRNEVGEIWISGDSVTKGYWNNPEKDKAFQSIRGVTCFNTGDLGITMDNELYILGRNVDAFIYHGKNYYYSDIEYIIESADKNLVQSGALVLLTTDHTIVLLCELRKKKVDFSLEALVQKIKRLLFIYFELTVEEMLLLPPYSIPKTSSGKKQRDASRKMYEDNLYKAIYTWKRTASAALHETGQTQKEDRILAALSRMISEIKKQETAVFYEDCFLDYITDSIDILKIVHQINIEFDIHLEVYDLLETNSITIDGIIQRIKTAATTGQEKKEIIVKKESLFSYGQLSIWLAENLDPSKDNNIVARAVNLTNFNRVPALIAAVKRSLNNHTILKTVCDSHLGEIIQKICPFEIHPDCFDGRNMTGPELLQAIHAYAYRPYQLSDGPLVRAGIYALEDGAVLVLSFHHLVVDFWSMEVLFKEIFDFLYLQEVPDITPDTTYFAYVKEQRELLHSDRAKKAFAYWQEALSGLDIRKLFSYGFEQSQSADSDYYTVYLPESLMEGIDRFVHYHHISHFVLLLSVFMHVIYRFHNQDDVVIGTVYSGRNDVRHIKAAGYFANVIPIAAHFNKNDKWMDFIHEMKRNVDKNIQFGDIPFSYFSKDIGTTKISPEFHFFNVLFTHIHNSVFFDRYASQTDERIQEVRLKNKNASHDMLFTSIYTERSIALDIQYRTSIFALPFIWNFADHLVWQLNELIQLPDIRLDDLIYQTEYDKQHASLLGDKVYDVLFSIPEMVCAHPKDKIAFYTKNEIVRYGELQEYMGKIRDMLLDKKLAPGTYVGIHALRDWRIIACMFGVMSVGCIFVPLDRHWNREMIQAISKEVDLGYIISFMEYRELFPTDIHFLSPEEADAWTDGKWENDYNVFPISCVNYTSGTIQKPNGAVLKTESLCNVIQSFISSYGVTADDCMMSLSSEASASFLGEVFPILCAGGKTVLLSEDEVINMDRVLEILDEREVTLLSTVPSVLSQVNSLYTQTSRLRLVLSGGEKLSFYDVDKMFQSVRVVNGYGLTETTICNTFQVVKKEDLLSGRQVIGKPIQNNNVYILNQKLQPVPAGCAGEIFIGGLGVFEGYIHNPGLTAYHLVQNPVNGDRMFKTGDMGRVSFDGTIELMGRNDRLVKFLGYRIQLDKVEEFIRDMPGMSNCAALISTLDHGAEKLVAFYTAKPGCLITATDIILYLQQQKMPNYMIPNQFVLQQSLPYSVNGKMDYKELERRIPASDSLANVEGLLSPTEKAIHEIWCEVLNVDRLSIHRNFFEMGGHSLMVAKVCHLLNQRLQCQMDIMLMFEYTTIYTLARYIDGNRQNKTMQDNIDRAQKIRERRRKSEIG